MLIRCWCRHSRRSLRIAIIYFKEISRIFVICWQRSFRRYSTTTGGTKTIPPPVACTYGGAPFEQSFIENVIYMIIMGEIQDVVSYRLDVYSLWQPDRRTGNTLAQQLGSGKPCGTKPPKNVNRFRNRKTRSTKSKRRSRNPQNTFNNTVSNTILLNL